MVKIFIFSNVSFYINNTNKYALWDLLSWIRWTFIKSFEWTLLMIYIRTVLKKKKWSSSWLANHCFTSKMNKYVTRRHSQFINIEFQNLRKVWLQLFGGSRDWFCVKFTRSASNPVQQIPPWCYSISFTVWRSLGIDHPNNHSLTITAELGKGTPPCSQTSSGNPSGISGNIRKTFSLTTVSHKNF